MDAKRKPLTTTLVRGLRPADQGEKYIIRDNRLPGFYVYVGSRSRTYYCEADFRDAFGKKKTKRLKIGDGNLMEASEARSLAMLELGKIRSGGYVEGPKTTRPGDATVAAAYEFMLEHKQLAPETLRSYRKAFVTENAPLADLMDARLSDLATERGRMLLKERHERLTVTSGPFYANRAFQNLRTVYRYALNRWDWLPKTGPTSMIQFNREGRYQVAKGVDAATIWAAIDNCPNPVTRSLWAATLLTGARPGEISRLRWEDVDLDEQTAIVHGTKTTSVFRYVLSEAAIEWFDKCRFDDEFVFFGRHKKYRDEANVGLLPLPLGKFRNIYMAYATKARVSPLLIKKLVNHKVLDVTEGYAAQDDLLLPDLIREQTRISNALTAVSPDRK
ncbi:MAG: site-specific integrase [Pseudomonadota bacterium]